MKITVDFEDLIDDYENQSGSALQVLKDEIKIKAVECLSARIGWALQRSINKSFPTTIKEENETDLSHDEIANIAKIFVTKYKKKIKEDIEKLLKD